MKRIITLISPDLTITIALYGAVLSASLILLPFVQSEAGPLFFLSSFVFSFVAPELVVPVRALLRILLRPQTLCALASAALLCLANSAEQTLLTELDAFLYYQARMDPLILYWGNSLLSALSNGANVLSLVWWLTRALPFGPAPPAVDC